MSRVIRSQENLIAVEQGYRGLRDRYKVCEHRRRIHRKRTERPLTQKTNGVVRVAGLTQNT